MSRMIEMTIDSVRVSLTNQQRIVVLREKSVERYLPIWIGPYEAEAITIALQDIEVARPQTHDLLKNLINRIGARLLRVEIIALREDIFYASLVIELNDQIIEVDSRPSDALALAVRAHTPILVAEEVLRIAGIVPEQDLQAERPRTQAQPTHQPEEPSPESEERLSIFEDFLQNLELDDLSSDTPPDDAPTPPPESDR